MAELQEKNKDNKIYEIGYLLIPLIDESEVGTIAGGIYSAIEKSGASKISEGEPSMRALAYPIRKEIDRVRHAFERAYFGWVKFEAGSDSLVSIKKTLEDNSSVLRFILIKTTKDTPVRSQVVDEVDPESSPTEETAPLADESVRGEELDREVDALIASATE